MTDTEREWQLFQGLVAAEVAPRLRSRGVGLTSERVRLDRTCDVAAVRRMVTRADALWIVLVGASYGREASIEQCRAAQVTVDRAPSVLDLVVHEVLSSPHAQANVAVHLRELEPGAPRVDRRALVLRANVEKWGAAGRAERYRVALDQTPASALQPWVDQVRAALERLLASRGLPPEAPAAPAPVPEPAPAETLPVAPEPERPPPEPLRAEPSPEPAVVAREDDVHRSALATSPPIAEVPVERSNTVADRPAATDPAPRAAAAPTPPSPAPRSVPPPMPPRSVPPRSTPWPTILGVVLVLLVIGWLVLRGCSR